MKRVIVTGATGFIGQHAVPALARRGYEVHAFCRTIPTIASELEWHCFDLLEDTGLDSLLKKIRASHLMHLAWCTEPGKYWTSTDNLRWVQASIELLSRFRDAGGQRAVGAGTCAEYDWGYGYCVEDLTPTNPASPYGISKDCVRRLLTSYSATSGLSSAWARVFHLYGPGEHPTKLVPSVIRGLLDGTTVPCTHGRQIRDYLHVLDVASALAAILDGDAEGPINVGSGRPLALKDLIGEIASIIGREDLVQLGIVPTPSSDPRLLVASTQRLVTQVAWTPSVNLSDGLRETVAWWGDRQLQP